MSDLVKVGAGTAKLKLKGPHEARVKCILKLHGLARQHAEEAIIYAAKAGAELLVLKNEVAHGGFETFVDKKFQFGLRTAQRYMALAEKMQAALDRKTTRVSLLTATAKTLRNNSALQDLTDGKTLTQLYLDLGVIKGPSTKLDKSRAGLPKPADLDDAENAKHRIDRALDQIGESLAIILAQPELDEHQAHRLGWSSFETLTGLLPKGAHLQVAHPVSKKVTPLAEYVKEIFGAPSNAEAGR